MKRLIRPVAGTAAMVLAFALTACGSGNGGGGGGGGGEVAGTASPPAGTSPAPPALVEGTDVPLNVTSDSSAATAFAKQLASSSDETSEPLRLGSTVLASSETEEPAPLN